MTYAKTYNWQGDFEDIIGELSEYSPVSDKDKTRIRTAFEFAAEIHKNQFITGDKNLPYIIHPIRTAKILLEVKPDIEAIIGCILHGVMYRTSISKEEIEQHFGSEVAFLCEKMTKIWPLTLMDSHKNNDDHLKKLLLAMAEDIRVVYIQLADIIDNLQHQTFGNKEEARIFPENALNIYAPIAQKLNLYFFKNQLEDYSFKILNPDVYDTIKAEVNANRTERKGFIQASVKMIEQAMEKEDIPYLQIYGRPKNFYSIYLKMKKKNYASVRDVYDLFALRIITNKESNCYRALGAIHAHWKPLPHRFKDYIAVPKPNGYQSLHTTILGLVGSAQPTEIQIKTEEMNHAAEFGSAAHWAYKKRKGSHFNEEFLQENEWLNLKSFNNTNEEHEQLFQNISQNVFEERIHVFTPKGEIKHLPKDATPVDFAYCIHSQVGDNTIGAKVNGRIKPLNHELKPGDVVEIMTKSGRQPNPLWLNFVKSSQAKSKIKNYLNKLERSEEGPKEEEKKSELKKTKPKINLPKTAPLPNQKSAIVIGGTKTKSYKLPKCCAPKPYQNIVAYNSRGLEFAVHRQGCKMLEYLDAERMLDAHFLRQLKFQIQAKDRVGILTEITDCIAQNNINTLVCNHKVTKKDEVEFNFEIEYLFEDEVELLFEQIRAIPNVEEIIVCQNEKPKAKK